MEFKSKIKRPLYAFFKNHPEHSRDHLFNVYEWYPGSNQILLDITGLGLPYEIHTLTCVEVLWRVGQQYKLDD